MNIKTKTTIYKLLCAVYDMMVMLLNGLFTIFVILPTLALYKAYEYRCLIVAMLAMSLIILPVFLLFV